MYIGNVPKTSLPQLYPSTTSHEQKGPEHAVEILYLKIDVDTVHRNHAAKCQPLCPSPFLTLK